MEERLSLKEVVLSVQHLIFYLFSQWKLIVLIGSSFSILVSVYVRYIQEIEYTAETTFVVESSSAGLTNDVSSLATAVGISLGGAEQSNILFNTDNILQLTMSYRLMRKTFMEVDTFDARPQRLITRFLERKEILPRWQEDMPDLTFEIPLEEMTVEHDSLLKLTLEDFMEKLETERIDRRLDILSIKVTDTDEEFAKKFNEVLVRNVNEFYVETKTLKTGENLHVLQKRADSVKSQLDNALREFGQVSASVPNPNSLQSRALINSRKLEIDITVAAAVYQEVLKQLEIAKITHQTNTPIIQIVDRPIFPLENSKPRLLKLLIINGFIGAFLVIAFLLGRRLYQFIMESE